MTFICALAKGEKPKRMLERLRARSDNQYVPTYNLAMICNGPDKRDEAIEYLKNALETRDARMILLNIDPKWNELRSGPRFADILNQVSF